MCTEVNRQASLSKKSSNRNEVRLTRRSFAWRLVKPHILIVGGSVRRKQNRPTVARKARWLAVVVIAQRERRRLQSRFDAFAVRKLDQSIFESICKFGVIHAESVQHARSDCQMPHSRLVNSARLDRMQKSADKPDTLRGNTATGAMTISVPDLRKSRLPCG